MAYIVCPKCETENEIGTAKCQGCRFQLKENPDEWAECARCDKWSRIVDMVETPDGWICSECDEEIQAEAERARESDKRTDRIARRWAWRF